MAEPTDPLLRGLFDDAAVFPPGNKPLEQAVPDHREHRAAHRELVGPLVLPRAALGRLPGLTQGWADGSLELSLTGIAVREAAAVAEEALTVPAVRLAALELTLGDPAPDRLAWRLTELAAALPGVQLYLEIPRAAAGDYDTELITALAETPALAKLRTGGVSAELYPSEAQLAAAIGAAVRADVGFKATAGLHHALRNTATADGETLEQHGFANLLWASGAALAGQSDQQIAAVLAERDPRPVAAALAALDPGVRRHFRSFGTCSIDEPVGELSELILGL